MMYELPEKLKKLVPYQPLSGSYRIRLDANESFLTPPESLRQEIAAAVALVNFNRYPDPYCTALCEKFSDYFQVKPEHIAVGNGSDELIGLIVSSFAAAGEAMVVVEPDFSMYAFYAQMCGVHVKPFVKGDSLVLDAEALTAFAKKQNARIVILSNPCNPTSLAASQSDIRKIVSELDCLVVVDEAYMDFSDASILREAAQYDNLIVLKTCSKAFGMAAIRLGFAVACDSLTQIIKAVKSPYNVNSMTQAAGCVLFNHPDYLHDCTDKLIASRNGLFARIKTLETQKTEILAVYNTCANFVFLRLTDARRVFEMLDCKGIAVRCMGQYLRITAGSMVENEAVLTALAEILN